MLCLICSFSFVSAMQASFYTRTRYIDLFTILVIHSLYELVFFSVDGKRGFGRRSTMRLPLLERCCWCYSCIACFATAHNFLFLFLHRNNFDCMQLLQRIVFSLALLKVTWTTWYNNVISFDFDCEMMYT